MTSIDPHSPTAHYYFSRLQSVWKWGNGYFTKKKNYFLTILKRANRSQSSSSRNFHFFIRHPTSGNGVENGCRSSQKNPSQAATIKEKLGSFRRRLIQMLRLLRFFKIRLIIKIRGARKHRYSAHYLLRLFKKRFFF